MEASHLLIDINFDDIHLPVVPKTQASTMPEHGHYLRAQVASSHICADHPPMVKERIDVSY